MIQRILGLEANFEIHLLANVELLSYGQVRGEGPRAANAAQRTGSVAQRGDVVVCLGRVIDGLRPRVGGKELQAVGKSFFGEQLQAVINGTANHLRFRSYSGELRIRKQQLKIRDLVEVAA